MACSLQQLLTRLTGNFLWERGSIQNRVRGELPWKLGPFLLRGYDFPRWVPDRIYLEDDGCWDRNSCNLQSGSPEGDGGEGGVSGQRHQLAGAGLHGDKQRPNPALLRNQWWEPKVVSSNYYARVHSNRPPLCRSLQERSSLALRQHQANQEEREFGGKLSCIEARAEIILSLKKKKKEKSTWMYVALKNRKTFWLLRNREQDTCLLRTSTKTQASLLATNSIPKQLGLQKLGSSPPGRHEWRKRISDPASALGGGNFSYEHGNVWDLTSLFLTVRFRMQPNHERELWQHESVNGSMSSRK